MDIHKPKPWRGWRAFPKAYAIVVAAALAAPATRGQAASDQFSPLAATSLSRAPRRMPSIA